MRSIELPQIMLGSPGSHSEIGQCDCNCDCACAAATELWPASKTPGRFRARIPAFDLPLPGGRRILANDRHGIPAVLNGAAYRILQASKQESTSKAMAEREGLSLKQIEPVLSGLLRAGLLVPTDEIALDNSLHSPKILSAWLHIVNDCQLACDYCYVQQSGERMSLKVGETSIRKLVKTAVVHGYRGLKIKYAGGEPTLNFGLVRHLAGMARQLCNESGLELEQVILSNGLRWDAPMIQTALDLDLRVMLSLDGLANSPRRLRNGLDSSAVVQNTLIRMIKSGLVPMVSVTISQRSLPGLKELAHWLLEHRIPFSLNFQRLDLQHGSSEMAFPSQVELERVMREVFAEIVANPPGYSLLAGLLDRVNLSMAHERVCGVGQDYLVIASSGQLARCQMAINQPAGNISDPDPLETLRQSSCFPGNPSVDERLGCKDCNVRGWCAGGCPLEALRRTGSSRSSSQYCQLIRSLVPEVLHLEGLRLSRQMEQQTRA